MRLRITFSQTGSLRYTGHLDLQTVWERTARRAALSLAYTHGFHPGPKIQIASALPLGIAGRAEIVDLWLDTDPGDAVEVQKRLQAGSPPGLTILHVEAVDEHGPALQTQVTSAEYAVTLLEPGSGSRPAGACAGAPGSRLPATPTPRQTLRFAAFDRIPFHIPRRGRGWGGALHAPGRP